MLGVNCRGCLIVLLIVFSLYVFNGVVDIVFVVREVVIMVIGYVWCIV